MSSVFQDVYRFNALAGNNGGAGGILNSPMLRQSFAHCGEELGELALAIEGLEDRLLLSESPQESARLLEPVADAALDLIYVSVNVLYALGLRRPDLLWREVHASNMQKLPDCPDCGTKPQHEQGICRTCDSTRKIPPLRRADGKILKPDGWLPPDLTKHIIEELFSHGT